MTVTLAGNRDAATAKCDHCVRITSGGCPRGRQENDITRYARLAAGLCVLSVTLVFSGLGGTIAAADTETDGSVSDVHGVDDAEQQVDTTPSESTDTTVSPAVVETVPTLLGSFDTGVLVGSGDEETSHEVTARETEQESTGLTGPMALGTTIGSQTGTDATVTVTVTDDDKGSDTVPADATADMNEPEVVVSHSPVTEPSPDPVAPVVESAPPAGDPPAEESTVVQPVTNEAASTEDSAAQTEAAPPVVGPAAAGNMIAVLAYLFIGSHGEDAPFLTLPGGLLSLLGFPLTGDVSGTPITAGGIGGSLLAGGMFTAARTALMSALSAPANLAEMLIASGGSRGLSPAEGVVPQAIEGISTTGVKGEHLSMALTDSVVPQQVRSILRHVVGAVLAPLSLLVLALMASPGLAGLALLGAAGTFVGYRQARAASVLRAVGIARFVKAGPLGVVRSGGLVAVHTRPARLDRRQSHHSQTFDSVA
jgi:hypothetical protein